MVQLQIISKILSSKNTNILDDNLITADYFTEYKDEIDFILEHQKEYGMVPDTATFLSKFKDVELVEVAESDKYLKIGRAHV